MTINSNLLRPVYGALTVAALLSVAACEPKTSDPVTPEGTAYALFGSVGTAPNVQSLILQTNNLTEGTVSALGNGLDITGSNFSRRSTIQKDGFFYNIDGVAGKLGKYKLTNGKLETIREVPFADITLFNWFQWIDANTLLLTADGETKFNYAIINTENLTVTKTGTLPVPAPANGGAMFIGVHHVRDGKLHLFYSHFDGPNYEAEDTSRVAVMDYPAMTNVTISKDTRSTYPGCGYGNTPGAFEDENGDIYVITGPGPWSAYRPELPTGIFRVKKGARVFDPSYFFNTTKATAGEQQQGMWYLGNGKALVKSANPTVAVYPNFAFDYYVADVRTQTMTKLELPKSNANFKGEVLVENGKARIAIDTDGYVYTYDPATGSITKGLKVNGLNSVDLLLRVN